MILSRCLPWVHSVFRPFFACVVFSSCFSCWSMLCFSVFQLYDLVLKYALFLSYILCWIVLCFQAVSCVEVGCDLNDRRTRTNQLCPLVLPLPRAGGLSWLLLDILALNSAEPHAIISMRNRKTPIIIPILADASSPMFFSSRSLMVWNWNLCSL